jgi:hypothetical protein
LASSLSRGGRPLNTAYRRCEDLLSRKKPFRSMAWATPSLPTDIERPLISHGAYSAGKLAPWLSGLNALTAEWLWDLNRNISMPEVVTQAQPGRTPSGAGLSPRRNERAASGNETRSPDRQDPG